MEHARFSFYSNPLPLVTQFENLFYRLLKREQLDIYDCGLSLMFDVIAAHLMVEVPGSFGLGMMAWRNWKRTFAKLDKSSSPEK